MFRIFRASQSAPARPESTRSVSRRHSPTTWLCLLLAMQPFAAPAEQKPLWEAGIGLGYLTFPDYRGSDQSENLFLPVPYFVYRGDYLQADRGGMRGILYRSEHVTIKLSVNATIPVDSEDNEARKGMPDLKSTFQVGPSFELAIWESLDRNTKLDLRMPLRFPFTIESNPQGVGWIYLPRLNLHQKNALGHPGLNLGFGVGPIYADTTYHDYFYSVDAEYVTEDRPFYKAKSGPSGTQWFLSASKRFDQIWFGAYIRYDTLSGASFKDSPLVRKTSSLTGAIGFAWVIGQSKARVTVLDADIP